MASSVISCFAQSPYETLNDATTRTKISLYNESCTTIASSSWTTFVGRAGFDYWRVYKRFASNGANTEIGCYLVFANNQLNLYKLNDANLVRLDIEKLRAGLTSDEVAKRQRQNDPIQVRSEKLIASTIDTYYQNTYFVKLFDSPCGNPKLINDYPKKAEVYDQNNNNLVGVSCYIANTSNEQVFITGQNYSRTLPFSKFENSSTRSGGGNNNVPEQTSQPDVAKGLVGLFDGVASGIAGAQRFQQPPPGFVYIPPGTSRSNYMTCTPDGRGGYYCK
jgi:hypothetical protein